MYVGRRSYGGVRISICPYVLVYICHDARCGVVGVLSPQMNVRIVMSGLARIAIATSICKY